MQVAAIVGFILAMFAGGYMSDVITARDHQKQRQSHHRTTSQVTHTPVVGLPAGLLAHGAGRREAWAWYYIAITFGMREWISPSIGSCP